MAGVLSLFPKAHSSMQDPVEGCELSEMAATPELLPPWTHVQRQQAWQRHPAGRLGWCAAGLTAAHSRLLTLQQARMCRYLAGPVLWARAWSSRLDRCLPSSSIIKPQT